jgi:hypothetical protein
MARNARRSREDEYGRKNMGADRQRATTKAIFSKKLLVPSLWWPFGQVPTLEGKRAYQPWGEGNRAGVNVKNIGR